MSGPAKLTALSRYAGRRIARRLPPVLAAFACVLALSLWAVAQPKPGGRAPGPAPGGGASAAGPLLAKVTPEQMADILTKAGYESHVEGSGTQKFVAAQFFPGVPGKVLFARCEDDGCTMVGFLYDFGTVDTIGLDWVNAWNDEKSVSAVLQDNGSLQMVKWTHLFGPVTGEHLAATARRFVDEVNSSSDFQPGN